jgi:hypothetical protein
MRRRLFDSHRGSGARRCVVYAECSEAESAVVKQFARREGMTISDFVRRCINAWLLEEGDDVPLLTEFKRDRVDDLQGSEARRDPRGVGERWP